MDDVTSLTAEAARDFSGSFSSFGCQRGRSDPEDITCSVLVSVGGMSTGDASERCVADVVLLGDMPAGVAAVGGAPGVHVNQSAPSFFRFGLEDVDSLEDVDRGRPACVVDASIASTEKYDVVHPTLCRPSELHQVERRERGSTMTPRLCVSGVTFAGNVGAAARAPVRLVAEAPGPLGAL